MKTSTIVSIISFALTAIFLGLTALWRPFCLFASVFFLIGVSIPFYITLVGYIRFKNELKEKRFTDAYLYAEEHYSEEKIKDFKYDKKTERKLKMTKYNNFTSMWSVSALLILAIVLLAVAIKIVFF